MNKKSTLRSVANDYLTHPKNEKGITLIALIITTIFSYDENIKSSNNKGFLLQSI